MCVAPNSHNHVSSHANCLDLLVTVKTFAYYVVCIVNVVLQGHQLVRNV